MRFIFEGGESKFESPSQNKEKRCHINKVNLKIGWTNKTQKF
jgi:hypothetical protein